MQLIQKLQDDKKCMKKVEPSSRSKAIEDIISIGSFVEALVLNHYVLVRKILQSVGGNRMIFLDFLKNSEFKDNGIPHEATMYDNHCKYHHEYPLSYFRQKDKVLNEWVLDSFDIKVDYGKMRDNPYSRRFDECKKVRISGRVECGGVGSKVAHKEGEGDAFEMVVVIFGVGGEHEDGIKKMMCGLNIGGDEEIWKSMVWNESGSRNGLPKPINAS
ncbi:hypothetical protein Tco_1133880 [Tanacetum coccineum]